MVNNDASITKYDNKVLVACVNVMIRIRGSVSISFNKILQKKNTFNSLYGYQQKLSFQSIVLVLVNILIDRRREHGNNSYFYNNEAW